MAATVILPLLLSAFLNVNCACVCIILHLHQLRNKDAVNSFQMLNSLVLLQLQDRKLCYHCDILKNT